MATHLPRGGGGVRGGGVRCVSGQRDPPTATRREGARAGAGVCGLALTLALALT